eukprot:3602469-Prymnesium_polylepis.1
MPIFCVTSFSCACFFVPPSEAAMSSMLNLTLMLVLTIATYIKHVSDVVPKLSYQTLLDTYCVLSMLMLAAVVVQDCIVGPLAVAPEERVPSGFGAVVHAVEESLKEVALLFQMLAPLAMHDESESGDPSFSGCILRVRQRRAPSSYQRLSRGAAYFFPAVLHYLGRT